MDKSQCQGPVLKLEEIVQVYGLGDASLTVLDKASMTLNAGEMVALVAPSGTGKSTLLHIAGLLEKPISGSIRIDGIPCETLSDKQRTKLRRTKIGVIYQFHHLLPEFTALENIIMPQLIRGVGRVQAKSHALKLLEYMLIADRADHRPSELSGGEQQRVAIARAVANRPKILFADEPTGNLDPETSDSVFETLTELVKQTGLCALIVTHNKELADKMDRVITIENRQIRAA